MLAQVCMNKGQLDSAAPLWGALARQSTPLQFKFLLVL